VKNNERCPKQNMIGLLNSTPEYYVISYSRVLVVVVVVVVVVVELVVVELVVVELVVVATL
jgi:hypothetical protein